MDEITARRSTLLLAASSALSFSLNVLRTKLLALAWGPAGVGYTGLMQAAMGTTTLAVGLGIDGLVARDIAQASAEQRARVAAAATAGVAGVASVGAIISTIALMAYLPRVGLTGRFDALLLAIGAAAGVVGANLRAALSGLGAARAVASSSVAASLLALMGAGVLVLAAPTHTLLTAAVVVVPIASLLSLAVPAARLLPKPASQSAAASVQEALRIAKRATIFTAAGVLPPLAQTAARTLAASHLNDVELGQMQAAAAIAAISTSLLAASVGPVVIPQLSAAVQKPAEFSTVLGRHTTFLITLYAPLAIGTAALSDVALRVLYSTDFISSGPQLGWQIVGEVLRLPIWLMATALVILQRGRGYFVLEATALFVQLGGLSLALPTHDPATIGLAFTCSSVAQFILASWMLRRSEFRWPLASIVRVSTVAVVCAIIVVLPRPWSLAVAVTALIPAFVTAVKLVLSLRQPGRS